VGENSETQVNTKSSVSESGTDQFETGGHKFGWAETGYVINQTFGECTTNVEAISKKYPEVRYEAGLTRKKRAVNLQYERQSRIVGGGRTNVREFPWIVSLQVQGTHVCGGTVILSRWILTAAHCTNVYEQPGDWQVLAGVSNSRDYSYTAQQSNVKAIIQHAQFDAQTYDNDISLLYTTNKFRYDEKLQPACMPHPEEHKFTTAEIDTNDSELDCYVAGFGTIWAGGPPSGSLLAVSVPQVKNEQCNDWFYESTGGQASGWITNTMICAGYEEGRLDACQGDSGGPLSCVKRSVSADEHESSVWYVPGAVSWGMDCAQAKQPGVYTRVAKYYSWIWEKIEVAEFNGLDWR